MFDYVKKSFASLWTMRDIPQREALVVADSKLPPMLPLATLVVSSPGYLAGRDLKEYLEEYDDPHYMPIPTRNEVLALRALAFPTLSVDDVERRMELWGPIPRHVLVRVTPKQQRSIWRSVQALSIDKILQFARGEQAPVEEGRSTGDEKDVPHRVVHEHAWGETKDCGLVPSMPEYYERGTVTVASPAMIRYVIERVRREER